MGSNILKFTDYLSNRKLESERKKIYPIVDQIDLVVKDEKDNEHNLEIDLNDKDDKENKFIFEIDLDDLKEIAIETEKRSKIDITNDLMNKLMRSETDEFKNLMDSCNFESKIGKC